MVKLDANSTVIADNAINLTCSGEGIPAPEITWLWKNQPLVPEDSYEVITTGDTEKHSMLTILEADYEDRGQYTCVATNNRGTAETTTWLTVFGKIILKFQIYLY